MPEDPEEVDARLEQIEPVSTEPASAVAGLGDDPALPKAAPARKYSLAAIAIACAILVLPVIYLFLHRSSTPGRSVLQGSTTAANTPSVASLEALVRTSPTKDNRINLSLAYINTGASAQAIPILQGVVAEDKSNVIGWNDLCVAHTLQKDFFNAIDECNKAIALSPSFQLARNNLKWSSDEMAKTLAVIDAANHSTATRDAAFYLALGLNDLHVGNYDDAIGAWKQTLQLDPKNAIAANDIGMAYMQKKQPGDAIPWFSKAIGFDPFMQLAKNNLAWAQDEQAKAAR